MRSSARLARLGVVVPARNEAATLGPSLVALDSAAEAASLPLELVVVLDACEDGSESVARAAEGTLGSRIHVVSIDAGRVGTARRVGVERLLDILGRTGDWISTTDADSLVPPSWFRRQLAYRATGADLVAGTVRVSDWGGLARVRPRWEAEYVAPGRRHVHGANLGFRAGAYQRVGGFEDVTSDEDVRLVNAFATSGEDVVWATDLAVTTSARRVGRAPRGFASYLSQLAPHAGVTTPQAEAV